MKIALIGATGYVGSRLLTEALARGHRVTAIARHPRDRAAQAGLTPVQLDIGELEALATVLRGHDAVLLAVKAQSLDVEQLLEAVRRAQVPRLLVVGGAGSLEVAPGLDLVDSPDMPAQWKPEALAARELLRRLRRESEIDWTLLSPSALLQPGERTGRFRVGGDALLKDENGQSRISLEDLAVALIDELETPRHTRRRFTVGY